MAEMKARKKDSMMEVKHFDSPFELKELDDATGEFEGLAAVFNKADSFDDVILPGAFKKSLRGQGKRKVKMLHEHERSKPIGVWDELKETPEGLFARGHLLTELASAKETLILLKAGLLDSMSIGFLTVKDSYNTDTKVRELIEVKLFEVSLVLFPAQEGALISSVKALTPELIETKLDLENALRDAGFSQSTSKFIVAGWTPPARRNAEGEQTVAQLSKLTTIINPATQSGGQNG